jgi:hypothetical protein
VITQIENYFLNKRDRSVNAVETYDSKTILENRIKHYEKKETVFGIISAQLKSCVEVF